MKPSRELDALIAVKVMGWKWDDDTAWSPSGSRNSRSRGDNDSWWWLPEYSTSIEAAWEVVEKLGLGIVPVGNEWFCWEPEASGFGRPLRRDDLLETFLYERDSEKEFNTKGAAFADTAPLAICLAALKAVGVEG